MRPGAYFIGPACIKDMYSFTSSAFNGNGVVVVKEGDGIEISAVGSGLYVYFTIGDGELRL